MTKNDDYVISVLKERGIISQVQLDLVSRLAKTPLDLLLDAKLIDEDTVLSTIADWLGLSFSHINIDEINKDLSSVISKDIAEKYSIVPVAKTDHSIKIAMSDPMNFDVMNDVCEEFKGTTIEAIISPTKDVAELMKKLYY